MQHKIGIFLLVLLPTFGFAQQELKTKGSNSGLFSFGVRSTVSTFNHGNWGEVGTGVGGQFRLQLTDRINTEWFMDYLRGSIGNIGNRQDVHVGVSVMYYVLKEKSFQDFLKPYLIAGYCFDYTNLKQNSDSSKYLERWSSAVQAGVGNHFNLTEHLDLTLIAQYMIHLGDHAEAHIEEGQLALHEHSGVSLEGHLLFTLGVNYKIADLW